MGRWLREMRREDLAEVLVIEEQTQSSPWPESIFLQELEREGSHLWVAVDGHEVAGYANYWCVLDELQIHNVAVDPARQRSGFASLMMQHVMAEAARFGCTSGHLEVRASNIPAQALYRNFGFQQVAIRPKYYSDNGEDAIQMIWCAPETN